MRMVMMVVTVLCLLAGLLVSLPVWAETAREDLAVQADLKSAEEGLSSFFNGKLEPTPDAVTNHIFMLMDQEKYEDAIAKANLGLASFPGNAQFIADTVPTVARCYALLGREKAGTSYLDEMAAKYAGNTTPVGGNTTLGRWLALCVATQQVWLARRNGDYAGAAKASDGVVIALQKAADGRAIETLDVYSILNALVTQGRLWASTGDSGKACAAYERALAYLRDNPTPASEKGVKRQALDSLGNDLPNLIARCKKPESAEDQDAAVDRVDWLVQDGKWQLNSGRNYTAAIARFEEAISVLNKLDLSKLGADREDNYRRLRDEELPNEVKLTKEDNDHKAKVRKLIEQGQAEKADKPN